MSANKKRVYELLSAYVAEQISGEDLDELIAYIKQAETNDELYEVIDEIWAGLDLERSYSAPGEWLYASILNDPRLNSGHKTGRAGKRFARVWWFSGVAAMLCIAATLFLWPDLHKKKRTISPDRSAQHIVPGGKKATLTLSNGRTIDLNDAAAGQIAEEGAIAISKNAEGRVVYHVVADGQQRPDGKTGLNKISTPKGGEYQILLPDGSSVWLNAASSLTFPSTFIGNKREVSLEGEAYFEVVHGHPFIVNTPKQRIDVLGTKFNVSSYEDEPDVSTALLEGAVRITGAARDSRLLKPGEKAVSALGNGRLSVSPFSEDEVLAWKNGFFTFRKASLKDVMRTLSRWYDIEVFYQGNVDAVFFGGTISRFGSIEQLLNTISLTGSVKFKIEGRKVIVMT